MYPVYKLVFPCFKIKSEKNKTRFCLLRAQNDGTDSMPVINQAAF